MRSNRENPLVSAILPVEDFPPDSLKVCGRTDFTLENYSRLLPERLRSHGRDEGMVSLPTTYFGMKVMSRFFFFLNNSTFVATVTEHTEERVSGRISIQKLAELVKKTLFFPFTFDTSGLK